MKDGRLESELEFKNEHQQERLMLLIKNERIRNIKNGL